MSESAAAVPVPYIASPTSEPFFASKTMILLVVTMGFIFLLVVLGIAVKIIWGEDVFNMISSGIGGMVGQSVQGTYRNVKVDAPIRQQFAASQVAAAAPAVYAPPPAPGGI